MYSLKCILNDLFKCMHSCFDFVLLFYNSVVQPCRHSSHVATSHLNVATRSFSRIRLRVKKLTKLLFIAYLSILWRQQRLCRHKSGKCGDKEHFGWTTLFYKNVTRQVLCRIFTHAGHELLPS
jgi:hypothetical protein